ncbi:wax ester/triacylglycerol synthase family O-acyltransferase [Saccharopolyspora sp. WRP15-2]|uniref:Diacylglycerol O-acyltransferase n=1 Tax=Saccharopolyspora oryzae TaxID=2997343 RepID=A0ABT4V4Q0_9PSEU|nr:wax ester/triacylglycerol synthase family O-acyltransferase [Saccharopolyspora oryzae]MDA3628803.1 wax ester/triacylglycerol synthase family O-acyltransferase [Saccharopolyspora oryzae]
MTGAVSGLDWAFVCLEQQTAPMHLGAVAVFTPHRPMQPGKVAGLLAERAQKIPRMRLRLHRSWWPLGQAHWEEHPDFRAADHVHIHQVTAPGGRDELAALVAELYETPLDMTRPLWEIHVISGLDGDRFAVAVKLHHSLTDGCAAVETGLGLLDGFTPAPAADQAPDQPCGPLRVLPRPDWLFNALSSIDPSAMVKQTVDGLGIASDVLRNIRLPEPGSPLHARACASRRMALIPLDRSETRKIRAHHGGTTNDAALAIITGALRRWLSARGHLLDGHTVRALIPVNFRAPEHSGSDHNQLSGYLCELPVGEPDPASRVRLVRAAMDRNKATGPLRGPGAFPILAGRMPPLAHQLAAPVASQTAGLLFDTVITSVPLPDMKVTLGGAPLRELYPLAPLAAGHALSIAITPFRDTIHIGIQANRDAVTDLEKLSDALPHAVAELTDH